MPAAQSYPVAMSLAEAQDIFFAAIEGEGMDCPCCTRWGKLNPVHLYASQIHILRWFYLQHLKAPEAWIDVPNTAPGWIPRLNVHSKMKYWSLVEPKLMPDKVSDKIDGFWRITPDGIDFLLGKGRIDKFAWVFADEVFDSTGPEVYAKDCTEPFDYAEMMRGRYDAAAAADDFNPKEL